MEARIGTRLKATDRRRSLGQRLAAVPRDKRMVAYWFATLFVAGNAALAGTMDVLRIRPFFEIILDLGYPPYFATILGTWKVLGALALLAPGYPRLKEWAYAGSIIDYTAAIASYVAVGDTAVSSLSGPIVSIALAIVSWAMRPSSRRLAGPAV